MTRTEKRIEWKARIDAWKASRLSAAAWCREQDVNPSQMYYWIRSLNDNKADHPTCLWQTKNVGYGTSFMHVL